jgi:hypothetical protein
MTQSLSEEHLIGILMLNTLCVLAVRLDAGLQTCSVVLIIAVFTSLFKTRFPIGILGVGVAKPTWQVAY